MMVDYMAGTVRWVNRDGYLKHEQCRIFNVPMLSRPLINKWNPWWKEGYIRQTSGTSHRTSQFALTDWLNYPMV